MLRIRQPSSGFLSWLSSGLVLFIADLLHPVDGLAVERFLNGDVRHGRGRCGAVPVFLARRKPDDVARVYFLDRAALALRPTATGGNNQGLAQRVGVPGRASTRLERDACAGRAPDSARADRRVVSGIGSEHSVI